MKHKIYQILLIVLRGFAMGSADVVPGVSGGTVALVTGIYDRLVYSIHSFIKACPKLLTPNCKKAVPELQLSFLIPLACGMGTAILTLSKVITDCLHHYPQQTWALFLGLMLGSVVIVSRMIKEMNTYYMGLIILAAMSAYLITISTPFETPTEVSYFFFAGMIAIVAMILPGVSGSFLLLIMGKYEQIIQAINDLRSGLWSESLSALVPFACGCLVGIGLFSTFLNYMLKHFRAMTMSILLGLMLGSLHKLWPFRTVLLKYDLGLDHKVRVIKDTMDWPDFSVNTTWYAFAFMLLGLILVLGVEKLAGKDLASD
ncbi:MAG: DUF368 domain-containing protein [Planctomycetes bacterium]|nr:DUF368 domain-containing protein [Planctomycetota bacterium]